jgi:hypothetical protein
MTYLHFISRLQDVHLANMSAMFDSNESDNDGDDLCVEVAGPTSSWNPYGIAIATEFSNSKAILDAVDDLAHRFNIEVGLFSSSHCRPWLLSHLTQVCYLLTFSLLSIRNGRSGWVAIPRSSYASILYRQNLRTNFV